MKEDPSENYEEEEKEEEEKEEEEEENEENTSMETLLKRCTNFIRYLLQA